MTVRREKVILELEDQLSREMLQAAAATKLLERNLNSLSGSSVRTSRDGAAVQRSLKGVGDEADRTGAKLRKGAGDIDRFSGRLTLLLRAAALLGPALVPIGAAGIPAVAAFTAGLGAAVGGIGVAVLALGGLGDALKALDAYQLQPTTENLAELERVLHQLGPAGAQFATFLDSIEPQLRSLQMAAREGFLPGAEESIETLLQRLPQVRRIIFDIATGLSEVAESAADGLTGDRFRAFFDYLETDARPTLVGFAQATGNVVEGVANMLVAFAPMNRVFIGGMVEMTQAFADWSAGLGENDGFQSFLDYIRSTGPEVLTLIGQLATMFAAVAEAAAPVGQVLVPALTAVAAAIEVIAESDLGTPLLAGIAAMSALRLATLAWSKVAVSSVGTFVAGQTRATASILTVVSAQDRARMSAGQLAAAQRAQTRGAMAGAGRLALVLGGLALAGSGAGESIGAANTASLALMGSFAGPPGAAIGAGVGMILDVKASAENAATALRNFDDAMQSGDPEAFAAALEQVNAQLERQTADTILGTSFMGDFAGGIVNTIAPASNLDKIVGSLTGSTDDLREATEEQAPAAEAAAAAMERKAGADGMVARVARIARVETRELNAAMEEQVSIALAAFDAVTQYAQALIEARKQAEKSNRGIMLSNDLTRKQRLEVIDNRNALSQLAGAWNNQGKAIRNNMGEWRAARGEFIDTAREMGATASQARKLADDVLEIPKQRQIDIKMYGSKQAADELERIRNAVMRIPKTWSTTYYVNQVNAINKRAGGGTDGDPSTPWASGGYTGPGGKFEPRGIVHAGEVVIPQELAKRDWSMLSSRYGHLPGFADGGVVGASNDPDRSIKTLTAALDKLTKSFDKQTEIQDRLLAQRSELKSGIAGGLRSDIFAAPSSPWSQQGSPISGLRSDIRDSRRFSQLVKELADKGVDGAALQEIIASGDVQRAEMMANLSRRTLGTYERLYDRRERLVGEAGGTASRALGLTQHIGRVTDRMDDMQAEIKGLRQDIRRKEKADDKSRQNAAKTTADGVNNAAAGGARAGSKGP